MAEESNFRVKNTLVVNGSFVANSTVVNAAAVVATSVNATSVNTATANATTSIVVGSNVTINTSTAFIGNTSVNTSITAGQISVSGVTVNSTIYRGTANNANNLNGQPASFYTNATNLATGTVPTARLGSGTASSTTFLAGDQSYKTAVTSVATGSGLTGGPVTTTGTVSVLANNGLSANATGVYVVPGNGIVTANSTGVHVGAGSGISVNSTAVAVLPNTGIVANATGVFVNAAYINTISSNSASFANASVSNTFTVGTASYFVANGNLGIGTSAPFYDLTINGGALSSTSGERANAFQIYTTTNNTDYLNFAKIRQATGSDWTTAAWRIQQVVDSTSQGYIQFNGNDAIDTVSLGTGDTERMRIASNGNIGIGNTAPAHRLRVQGDISLSGGIHANGSLGTAGQVLHSNGTSVYWGADDGTVTSVATGSGLTGGPITTTGTISVVANSGLSANATGIYVVAGNGIVTTNSTGVHVGAGNGITVNSTAVAVVPGNGLIASNSTGVHVGAGNGITVNSTAVAVLANSGIVANSTGVFVNTTFIGTLTANNANNFNGQNAAFYTNATNISTGTLDTARLPATANITTAVNVGANVNLTTSSINVGNSTVNVFINSTSISVTTDPLVQLSDIGTAPDQIPLNQYLGTLAYQSDSIAVANVFAIGSSVTFAANGNVGIGTATPTARLEVVGTAANDSTSDIRLRAVNGDLAFHAALSAGAFNPAVLAGDKGIIFNDGSAETGSLVIGPWSAGNGGIRITATANVGIGNSAPAHKLRVQGDISLSGGIHANGSLGTAGQTLHSNGTVAYWDTDDQGVTSVATGSGLTGGPITTTGTVSVLANSGIVANATGVFVLANSGIVANATGVYVNTTYIATLTANNSTNFNGQPASFYTNATNLATGTVPTARLGSGTASATTFLSGDQTYKTAITSVATGFGLTGGTITTTGTVSVIANNGLSANATGVYVVPGNGLVTANATGVHVGAGSGITVNTTAVAVLANSGIIANATGVFVNANSGIVANATGVYVNTAYIGTLTANNSTNFNGQAASFYTNATNISSGTLATARLPATANVTTAVNVGANVNLTTSRINVGNSTVNTAVQAGTSAFQMNAPANTLTRVEYRRNGLNRWSIDVNTDAETGNSQGSSFAIVSYSDDGSSRNIPLFIERNGGSVTLDGSTANFTTTGDNIQVGASTGARANNQKQIIFGSNTRTTAIYMANSGIVGLFDYTANTARWTTTSSNEFQFNSGYGSVATAYGCRAWVNFNGTGTVAIRGSGNVSSITDNNTGDYTVNFTNAMPDANYAMAGTGEDTDSIGDVVIGRPNGGTKTTAACRLKTLNNTNTATDYPSVELAFFR